ncbi:MAG: DNA repair protein RadC [Eubacteriaceae bacterium]|jgi:DNA repair protein RadC|nr:DNA repair protein RadC [Eubacteriaceae bacterium]
MIIREMPENEKPREKMIMYGRESLSNAELLAILVRTGCGGKSAVRLADEILSLDAGGIVYLTECRPDELAGIKGIGMAKACQILAAVELGSRIATSPRTNKTSAGSVGEIVNIFMEKMRYYKKEFFNVLLLNAKNEMISSENVAVGDLSSSIVHPREAFNSAVRKSAASVVFVHNHPSGNPAPSREDINITKRLEEAGKILGIRVLDHIIIGDGTYVSFKEQGLI